MQITKLTIKEIGLLPKEVLKRFPISKPFPRYVLEKDGQMYYGFHTSKDAQKAFKPQRSQPFIKII